MRIQICELDVHRNETTFRPYLNARNKFLEYDIQFVDKNPDVYFVGQSSIMDKKVSLKESIEKGINFLSKLDKPFVIFDGQDSSTLMGVWDVFKETPGIKLAKNVILSNIEDYTVKYPNGRWFWGKDEENGYSISKNDLDLLSENLILSGTNWLNTFGNHINFLPISKNKKYDVAVLIGLSKENYEYGIKVDHYYNEPRNKLFSELSNLNCNVITTEKTGKLEKDKYLRVLEQSKFCISPFGYGEINIREIECLFTGTILIKPSIENVISNPYIYGDDLSITCNHDFSNLSEVINTSLNNYDKLINLIHNQRNVFTNKSNDDKIVKHIINNVLN